jgi:hypothetical protein
LVFALLAHNHLWLVAGALASSLTYSGAAAIHACMLVWRGPGPAEMDLDALTAILIPACLIIVPLLNWSSTLRNLGAYTGRRMIESCPSPASRPNSSYEAERQPMHTPDPDVERNAERRAKRRAEHAAEQGRASTRTIVIYWAFLVTTGMLSVASCTVLGSVAERYISGLTVELLVGNAPLEADVENVICAPGTNTTIDYIDPNFVNHNNCTNPCLADDNKTLFRPIHALVLLDRTQARRSGGNKGDLFGTIRTDREKREIKFIHAMQISLLIAIPYVILQGLWAVCFGRRGPKEVRDLLFVILTSSKIVKQVALWRSLVKWFAFIVYLGAVLVVLICAPLFIMCIIANELTLSLDLSSEEPYLIGQWGPCAAVGLVLFAALVASYHHSVVVILRESWHSHTSKANWRKPPAAHFPRPFAYPPWKRTRTTALPRRDTDPPVGTEVPTVFAAVFIAMSKVLHFFWDPLLESVRKSTRRLHGEFANAKGWLSDPVETSKKTMRLREHTTDNEPPYNHLMVDDDDDDHSEDGIPMRTGESTTSLRDRDDDVESRFQHSTVHLEPESVAVSTMEPRQRRAASVDSGERRLSSRTVRHVTM